MERDNLLKKITSPNGGIFTGAGTNSYLIGKKDITLVDPGPNISKHLDKLVEKADNNIKRILVTHTHMDHSPGAKPLAERLSIPCYGKLVENDFSIQDESFKPDFILSEDEHIETEEYTIKPIHTPGHASNHYCFLIDEINSNLPSSNSQHLKLELFMMKLIKPEFGSDVKSIGYRLDLLEGQTSLSRSVDEDTKSEEKILADEKPKDESKPKEKKVKSKNKQSLEDFDVYWPKILNSLKETLSARKFFHLTAVKPEVNEDNVVTPLC